MENLEVVAVHDSAANMKNGMQCSNIIHRSLPCSDNLLNLAISGAVTACPEMNSAVERCTALASKSHKSTLAKQRIQKEISMDKDNLDCLSGMSTIFYIILYIGKDIKLCSIIKLQYF